MQFITNPWIIGIGGGIISGIVVTLLTRYLFSKREQKEYRQRVETANNEIIYAIRPSIAEKVVPKRIMVDSLLTATAGKYGVDKADLHNLFALSNELIKEVMDNTFLSSQQKVEFCDLISTIREPDETGIDKPEIEIIRIREKDSAYMSMVLGVTTAIMAMFMVLLFYMKDRGEALSLSDSSKLFPMLIAITIVPIIAFMLTTLMKRFKEMEISKKEDEHKEEKSTLVSTNFKKADKKPSENDDGKPNKANSADAKSRAAD